MMKRKSVTPVMNVAGARLITLVRQIVKFEAGPDEIENQDTEKFLRHPRAEDRNPSDVMRGKAAA